MRPPAMLFYPQYPRPEAVAAMVCQALGYRIVTDVRAWRNDPDFAQALAAAVPRVHDSEWCFRRFSPRT